MTVTKTAYTNCVSVEGTMAEVLTQLSTDKVNLNKVEFVWNGTNISAVYPL